MIQSAFIVRQSQGERFSLFLFPNPRASDRLSCLPQRAMQGSTGPMIHVGITTWERKRCRQEQQKQRIIISRLVYMPLTQRRRNRSLCAISFCLLALLCPCASPTALSGGLDLEHLGRMRNGRATAGQMKEQIANNEAYTDQRNSVWSRELVTNGGLFGTVVPRMEPVFVCFPRYLPAKYIMQSHK
ncbi:hypothetical protein CI102_750 [Trichoderma harzianum]|nr:hypothetical protein CI102_750 [Trichoderma harzianum]